MQDFHKRNLLLFQRYLIDLGIERQVLSVLSR